MMEFAPSNAERQSQVALEPKRSIDQSRLYGFNLDLLRNIYEYDDTPKQKHKKYFFDNVRQEIWCRAWMHWWSNLDDIYLRVIMDYLMRIWGVHCEVSFSEYYINQVFPSELSVVSCVNFSGKYYYTIYYDGHQTFSGWVLNAEQEHEEVFGDGNWTEVDKMHVHTDYINKLYVYENTGN